MEFFSFLSGTKNEVADFYAGLIKTTLDLDIKKDLQACMVRDDELTKLWDMTIEELATDQDKWEDHFDLALKLSPHNMEACSKLGKVAVAGEQLQLWWEVFWMQDEADDICGYNFEHNQGKSIMQVAALRMDWELGYYYDAGKRFGKLWNILIGKPEWQVQQKQEAVNASNVMAIYEGAALAYLFKNDQTKALEQCIINDPIEVAIMEKMVYSISEYDSDPAAKFAFDKYFTAIETLDYFNWSQCKDKEVQDLIAKDEAWWKGFWSQKDAEEQVKKNTEKNAAALEKVVYNMQSSWKGQDYASAGKAYGEMWALLMGGRPADAKTEEEVIVQPEPESQVEEAESEYEVADYEESDKEDSVIWGWSE